MQYEDTHERRERLAQQGKNEKEALDLIGRALRLARKGDTQEAMFIANDAVTLLPDSATVAAAQAVIEDMHERKEREHE